MHSTHLRCEAIHGLLVGTACGEAIGLCQVGSPASGALKVTQARKQEGSRKLGFYGTDTHLLLCSSQSVLNSCSTSLGFQRAFQKRLAWYALSMPVGISFPTWLAGAKSWLRWFKVPTGSDSDENSALSRAMLVALALHGTGHSLNKWIDGSTNLTHAHPMVTESCFVLANLAQLAANAKQKGVKPVEILNCLAENCRQVSLKDQLAMMAEEFQKQRSARAIARDFGWGILPDSADVTLLKACYSFLRHPDEYYGALELASVLGRDHSTLGAVVGGLVGAHLGFSSLPQNVQRCMLPLPHGQRWMFEMSQRVSQWPHGAEDLNWAPSLRSWPLMQLLRNLSQRLWRMASIVVGVPFTMVNPSRSSVSFRT
jgi:ADP-ribosylglycohydrolase